MSLQGMTTIQLFDAKTNEIVQEVKEKNMLTNAVQNLLNPEVNDMAYDGKYATILDNIMPISTAALGGVLLFDNNIQENANIMFPPVDTNCVGWAGDAYSGTFQYRGSYNTNESGAITNGWRNVWDFGTDKANGIIKCVSLTSRDGGNTGFANDSNNSLYHNTQFFFTESYSYNTNYPIVELENGVTVCIYPNSNGTITINYIQNFNKSAIHLTQERGTSKVIATLTFTPEFSGDNYYWGIPMYSDRVMTMVHTNSSDKTQFEVFSLNVDSKIITRNVINIAFPTGYSAASYGTAGFYNDVLYVGLFDNTRKNVYVTKYSVNGELIEITNKSGGNGSSNNYSIRYHVLNGEVFESTNSNFYCLSSYMYSMERALQLKFNGGLMYSDMVKFPYILTNCNSGSYVYPYLSKYNVYLGSINNLATPVTKTNAQTMKITYDITEV